MNKSWLHFEDTGEYLKARDLHEGKIYIFKDGRVCLYLGCIDGRDYKLFYRFTSILTDDNNILLHGEFAYNYLCGFIRGVMQQPLNKGALHWVKMPKLIAELQGVSFESDYYLWYTKNKFMQPDIPVIVQKGTVLTSERKGYVTVKELVAGRVYAAGDASYADCYVYLGRVRHDGKLCFLWCYIGNDNAFRSSPIGYIQHWAGGDISITQANKKLRPSDNWGSTVYISEADLQSIRRRYGGY